VTVRTKLLIVVACVVVALIAIYMTGILSTNVLSEAEKSALLRSQAQAYLDALENGDFEVLADRSVPEILAQPGGREKFIATMENLTVAMKKDGLKSTSLTAQQPEKIVDTTEGVFAAIPYTFKVSIQRKPPQDHTSRLIGVSRDGGKIWKFAEGTSKTRLKYLIPDLPSELLLRTSVGGQ
jgi:hypothetical protein